MEVVIFRHLPKHSRILENVYHPLWTVAKFGSFLLGMVLTVAASQNWKENPDYHCCIYSWILHDYVVAKSVDVFKFRCCWLFEMKLCKFAIGTFKQAKIFVLILQYMLFLCSWLLAACKQCNMARSISLTRWAKHFRQCEDKPYRRLLWCGWQYKIWISWSLYHDTIELGSYRIWVQIWSNWRNGAYHGNHQMGHRLHFGNIQCIKCG